MKRLALIIATLALGCTMMAQTHYEGNVSIGAKGGVTLSRIQFNPNVKQSFLPGMMVGVTCRYMEERHFGLIAEVNMEQRGRKENIEAYYYKFNRRLTYIQIPILTHIYFGSNKFHGFFNAGPEIGFMIAESTTANFDYKNLPADFPTLNRHNEQFTLPVKSKFDYGISAGLGIEFIARNKSSFNLEGRFYYGLRNVFSDHKKDTFAGSSSMSLMITLGYAYRVK